MRPSPRTVPSVTLVARHILPMASPPLEGGWVRIQGGKVVGLGRGRPVGPVIDLGEAIVMPGLVNAHTHLEFSDFDSPFSADGGLPRWIERLVAARRSRTAGAVEVDRLSVAVERGLSESAASGVTAVGEIATARPPASCIRGPLVRAFRESLGLSPSAMADARRALRCDLDRMTEGGMAAGVSPHSPYTVAMPLGRFVVDEAIRRRLPMAMHLAESRAEEELLATGRGPLREMLERLGAWHAEPAPLLLPASTWISLVARAPRGIVVHGTYLPEDPVAMARLARHRDRLCVAVCPRTTRTLAGRLPPVDAFRSLGVRVAIGTDSRASNPDLSILAECRSLADGGGVSPAEALAMATLGGAWALAFERRCGRLGCGRPADLVVLRGEGPCREPFSAALDPATRVVATLRRGRVIAGRLT